ncbi:hypothetical protein [Propionispora vibrioides]|uniref:Uncharacterized protein n=1 Tax=Propionispora vibrioides TaxID=112903 RepID=A0A1H8RM42_9FIRM|nr:hypothetical protein [Propionispora vibrioides]SEO67248.1 hypothetical protein SAMN04490178_1041 [Propionispora vibrioides]
MANKNKKVKLLNEMSDVERAQRTWSKKEWNDMPESERNRLIDLERIDREEIGKFLKGLSDK